MAEQLKAEVRTHTRISGIDPGHKRLWIGEEAVSYRDLILAWGAETVRVPVQGDAAELIFFRSTTWKTTHASGPRPLASVGCCCLAPA
nr:hypothetical protein GCM10020185_31020 [Pseudomonas brassicacearum subsp. brassicacearum]